MSLLSMKFTAKNAPVGDFMVRRALPQREHRFVGPFCFLDHMGPHTSIGVAHGGIGPHPHIGLSTVTYLFDGAIVHRDSLGTEQLITPGAVNWMTAGSGIVHSERTPPDLVGQSTTLHGLQVWVGLPTAAEESAPSFQHAPKASLPVLEENGVSLRVLLGEWQGLRSPIRLTSPTFYAVAELEAGSQVEVPTQHSQRAIYVVDGNIGLDGTAFGSGELAILTAGEPGCVSANTQSRIAIFGGEPLDGPRFLSWNFVSSRRERLLQAADDWKHRRFPLVPGDTEDRIPMPGE